MMRLEFFKQFIKFRFRLEQVDVRGWDRMIRFEVFKRTREAPPWVAQTLLSQHSTTVQQTLSKHVIFFQFDSFGNVCRCTLHSII